MPKLTKAEERLIRYPPTPVTWECVAKRKDSDGETFPCGAVNSRLSGSECWQCHARKPKRPKLIWPEYVAACKKAGIEPKGQS